MPADPTPAAEHIVSIAVRVRTAGADPDGTPGSVHHGQGHVHLGIAGREFALERDDLNGFQQHADDTYVFGAGANVCRPDWNDPRHPPRDLDDLRRHPVYLRFIPPPDSLGDDWHLDRVDVTVTKAGGGTLSYVALPGEPSLWLGYESGLTVYLDRCGPHPVSPG
ncbi:hypothetical protein GCM10022419_093330 [Nonomuraea rosea]|uniref:Uncharacterized protein n=1 Tax=Nonomuraea rosea TaxID=638574 RepID=A0ABP6Z022_9ACTN